MDLFDTAGRRLYLTSEEHRAFLDAVEAAPREVRTFCLVLHYTGCRISESLALTPESFDFSGKAVIFETLKKRRRGIYRAVPVPGDMPRYPFDGARPHGGSETPQRDGTEQPLVGLVALDGLPAGEGGHDRRRNRRRSP